MVAPEKRLEAEQRYEVIRELLEFRKRLKRGEQPVFRAPGGQKFATLQALASWIGKQQEPPLSVRTVFRWIKRYAKEGLVGLADPPRKDKGRSRSFESRERARKYVEAKYLAERLPLRLCHESLVREWPNLEEQGDPPSETATRHYLKSLPAPLVVVGREGARGYNTKIEPYLLRDFDAVRVNQVWVSDHRQFDLWTYNDCFPHSQALGALRLWWTAIEDMRSRKIVGWAFCVNPSSDSIASALRMAISRYGLPEECLFDNGKDYKKIAGTSIKLSQEAAGLLDRLHIRVTHALPRHPQAKLIESFFSGQSRRFDVLFGKAYAGRKPALRSDECTQALKDHQLWLRNLRTSTPLGSTSDFIIMAEQAIREYNARGHSGRAMNGRSPDAIFEQGCPEAGRTIPDMMALGPLFWECQTRTVQRGGYIELYREKYEGIDGQTMGSLFAAIDQKVHVACDPNNLAEALVYDLDGQCLGTIRAHALVEHGPNSREEIKASLRNRRLMLSVMKRYIAYRAQGVPTELDSLRRRAGFPIIEAELPSPAPKRLSAAASADSRPKYVEDVVDELMKMED